MENKKLLLQLGIARLGFLSTEDKLKLENNLDNISNLAILSIDDISLIVGRVVNTREWPVENFEKMKGLSGKKTRTQEKISIREQLNDGKTKQNDTPQKKTSKKNDLEV